MAISSPYVCSIWCTSVTNGRDLLASLGDPSKFQRVSRLGFVTTGGQPNFARCLSVSWAGILYIHFRRLLLLTEFCQEQYSLYVQVVRSPICQRYCTALEQRPSAKLCGVIQEIESRKFLQRRHLYSAGRLSRWASAHILVYGRPM